MQHEPRSRGDLGWLDVLKGVALFWIFLNHVAEKIFGYPRAEALGQDLSIIIPPPHKQAHRDYVRRYVATRSPRVIGKHVQLNAQRRDGSEFPISISFSVAEICGNLYFTGIIRDISEYKQMENRVLQAERLAAVGNTVSHIAHEIKNPLAIIGGFARQLLKVPGLDDKAQKKLAIITEEVSRLEGMIAEMRDFVRRPSPQKRPEDLEILIEEVLDLFEDALKEHRITVQRQRDGELPHFSFDRQQIHQVLINLLKNALEAMPHGGELKIETYSDVVEAPGANPHGSVAGKYAVLSVSDTGHGMDAETRAKIFEPFFTTKDTGTGLGLSTVYGIVQQIKGSITVRSELGRGSVFCVQFPCVADAETPAETFEVHGRFSGSGKILLVEDEEAVRRLALRMLSEAGYTVVSTKDAGDALRLPKAELDSINLVVTDVVMFGMSGPDLAGHLLKRHPELKVLYLSGYTDHPLISAGALSHRERLLQKPFTRNQLLIKVQELLHGELRAGG